MVARSTLIRAAFVAAALGTAGGAVLFLPSVEVEGAGDLPSLVTTEGTGERTCTGNIGGAQTHACRACWLSDRKASRLFIQENGDGLGSRTLSIISAMAAAAKYGLNFGGVYRGRMCAVSHEVDIFQMITALFGLKKPKELYVDILQVDAVCNIHDLEAGVKPGQRIFFSRGGSPAKQVAFNAVKNNWSMNEYFTPSFLTALRRPDTPLMTMPLMFAPKRLAVAVHVRRGDVPLKHVSRSTPDWWYFKTVERIRQRHPDADVHVYSDTGPVVNTRHRYWTSKAFDGYRNRSMTLHLDEDVLEAWAHFARADVLLMSKSSFVHSPAYLNPRCVIYLDYGIPPLGEWLSGPLFNETGVLNADGTPEVVPVNDAKLDACLARTGF